MTRLNPKATTRAALLLMAGLCALSSSTRADEGMWTFDNPPTAQVRQRYGLTLTPEWLAHLQRASVHFGGGSGSFVSPNGLVLTNHHVARGCIERLSTAERDLDGQGFYARTYAEELRCPGTVLKVLMSSEDVTAKITAAAKDAADDAARAAARTAASAAVESACERDTGLRCQTVALYGGAVVHLYRYKEWDDVRLVFAPPEQAANFGGDDDNFTFPRFAFDYAFARVYENGKPAASTGVLKLASQPLKEGDPVFVTGHPGSTDRLRPAVELQYERDVTVPQRLALARASQTLLKTYGKRSAEAFRQAQGPLAGTENWLKAMTGEYLALKTPDVLARKAADEQALRQAWARLGTGGEDPWKLAEKAVESRRQRQAELTYMNLGWGGLLGSAGGLVELAQERERPLADRLPGFGDAALPQIERRLRSRFPVYPELVIEQMTLQFTTAQSNLGAGHPFVKAVLGNDTPRAAAERLVRGTKLADPAVREALITGKLAAIQASTDPMIVLARTVSPMLRELSQYQRVNIGVPLQRAAEQIAAIRFQVLGTSVPPDATGTLRLSYGKVAGYRTESTTNPWKTTFGGLYARADAFDNAMPFTLSPPLVAARDKVDARWPLNHVSTNDIIGGNSGSPLVNAQGELVGLIFDGNIESLAGRYIYREEADRAVSVDAMAIVRSLETVFGAPALAAEVRGQR